MMYHLLNGIVCHARCTIFHASCIMRVYLWMNIIWFMNKEGFIMHCFRSYRWKCMEECDNLSVVTTLCYSLIYIIDISYISLTQVSVLLMFVISLCHKQGNRKGWYRIFPSWHNHTRKLHLRFFVTYFLLYITGVRNMWFSKLWLKSRAALFRSNVRFVRWSYIYFEFLSKR